MKSEPNVMHSTNHRDIGTSTATAPAAARKHKPDGTTTMSITGMRFNSEVVRQVDREVEQQPRQRFATVRLRRQGRALRGGREYPPLVLR